MLLLGGCPKEGGFSGGGRAPPIPPVVDTMSVFGTQAGCVYTFEPEETMKTVSFGHTIDPSDDIAVLSVAVKYYYNCGVPGESVVTAPWGGKQNWLLRFPTACSDVPSTAGPDHLNYDELDKDLLAGLTCRFASQFAWPQDVLDYGALNHASWPATGCLDSAEDDLPHEMTPLKSKAGKASDILYAPWTYVIQTRYEDRTFIAWDRDLDNDGTDEPEENWLAIYDSPCDGQPCENCADINQVELIITVQFTP